MTLQWPRYNPRFGALLRTLLLNHFGGGVPVSFLSTVSGSLLSQVFEVLPVHHGRSRTNLFYSLKVLFPAEVHQQSCHVFLSDTECGRGGLGLLF